MKLFYLKGKIILSARANTLRLPMIVPSVFIAVGLYDAQITYTNIISKDKLELFLTNKMKYQVEEVQE